MAAVLAITGAAVVGLLALEGLEEDAWATQQLLTQIEAQTERLHSWDQRVVLGQSRPDQVPIIQQRLADMLGSTDELDRLASADPAAVRLVEALRDYRAALEDELPHMVAGDLITAGVVQIQEAGPRYEAVAAALPTAQAAALARITTANWLLTGGSIATLLIALVATGLLAWAVERARRGAERRAEARFRALVQNAAELVAIVDPNGIIHYASPSCEVLLGCAPDDLVGTSLTAHVHPEDEFIVRHALESAGTSPRTNVTEAFRTQHKDGAWRHVEATWRNLADEPGIGGIVLNVRDVSERKALEDELAYRAFHDALTELPNRALLVDRLGHAFARSMRSGHPAAVLFVDLDNFKMVNDTLGHALGDQMLVTVAQRLRASIRPGDTVARLGGDEFIVLLEEVAEEIDAVAVAERCLEQLQAPLKLDGREVFVGASVGIAVSDSEPMLPDDLLRRADVAMYAAKGRGKGQYAVFDATMDSRPRERLEMEADLRRALERHELRLHYQPIVELETGRTCGVEALVRWEHPERGLVPPGDFIPMAEETSLIVPIGRWVLLEACRQAYAWHTRHGNEQLVMSVNISGRQFQHPGLVEDVASALRESGLPAANLNLEITETVAMEAGATTIQTLQALKGLGVQLAIDDFGTGYSSLSYLKRFPVDALKIDRSFVDGLGHDLQDTAIVRSVIMIAKSLDLSVTAEGIETVEQLSQLRALACDEGQGYYFARPGPDEVITRFLEQQLRPNEGRHAA